jgi:thiamine kinase-like enzyme
MRDAFKYWQMDFFRPWYLLRSRFNFQRCFRHLRALELEDESFAGFEAALREFVPQLRAMARTARHTPRCFCHMDYLRKNIFVSQARLQLIDWSEVKVGRVGFDGGAFLSALFRRNEMNQYIKGRDDFLKTY